jgi:hypothetical protein
VALGILRLHVNSETGSIMSPDLATLAQQADNALIAFLRAELELGLTFVNTAKVEVGFDAEGEQRARQLAQEALETIERFRVRIPDPVIQAELQKGVSELEKLLSSLRAK